MKNNRKKVLSIILVAIMILSVLPLSAFASTSISLGMLCIGDESMHGDAIDYTYLNATVEGDTAEILLSNALSDDAGETARILKRFLKPENAAGLGFEMGNPEDGINTLRFALGDFNLVDAAKFGVAWDTEENTSFKSIHFIKQTGTTIFDKEALDFVAKSLVPQSLDNLRTGEEVFGVMNDFANAAVEITVQKVPYAEFNGTVTSEQLTALNNAIEAGANAQTLCMLRVKAEIFKDGRMQELSMLSGNVTNNVYNLYAELNNGLAGSVEGYADAGNMHVLHITPDGATVTAIADKSRFWDDLVFESHMLGDFFIVNTSTTPVANDEPTPPDSIDKLSSAKLDTTELTNATASLSKTANIIESDTVTLTITPNANKKFKVAPSVTVDGIANVGEITVGDNGTYTCKITNVDGNINVAVSGNAEDTPTYTISATAGTGGSVTGGGTYTEGANVTVKATANDGYEFVRWEENGAEVSKKAEYGFTATGDRTLKAIFEVKAIGNDGNNEENQPPNPNVDIPKTESNYTNIIWILFLAVACIGSLILTTHIYKKRETINR